MTDNSLRDLRGSQKTLREAIGHLDDAQAQRATRARPAEVAAAPVRANRVWIVVVVLGLLAAAASATLLAA